RQRSCRHSLQHLILQCNAGAGRLPFGTQCSNARGQSLVLSHRTWHQAPLLVSPPGGRKGLAERPVELPGFRQADCAEARTGDPGFGRECPRRTVASANTRHGGQHRATAAGTRPECRQFHGPPACHCPDTSTPPPPTVASRWPEPSSTVPSASQTQAAADVDDTDVQPAAPVAAPRPPVALAAADAPAEKSPGHPGSIPMLSIVMMGALALAGLIGSVIVRFGGRRRRNRVGIAVDRDAMWDAISPEPRSSRATEARSSRPAPPVAAPMPRRPGFTMPRELQMADHAADRRDDRVTEMLARLARSAAR